MKGSSCSSFTKYAHWILRLQLAGVFVFHGVQKLQNIQGFADMLHIPYFLAFLVALGEFGCPILIILGGLIKCNWTTRIGAFFLSVIMIGAITMVHWGQWSAMATAEHPAGGMEYPVTLLAISLFFLVRGNCGSPEKA